MKYELIVLDYRQQRSASQSENNRSLPKSVDGALGLYLEFELSLNQPTERTKVGSCSSYTRMGGL